MSATSDNKRAGSKPRPWCVVRRHVNGGTVVLSRKETEEAARQSAERVGRTMRALGVTSEVYDVEFRPVGERNTTASPGKDRT